MRWVVVLVLLVAPAAAEPHGPIRIVGDNDFATPGNGVSGGAGTEDDPFVITDLEITPSLLDFGTGQAAIHIEGTDAHVLIRNVEAAPFEVGIRLASAYNVSIEDATLDRQERALWATEARDLRVDGLDASATRQGPAVTLSGTHRAVLRDLDVRSGDGAALQVGTSRFVRIEGSTFAGHDGGLRIQSSQDVSLVGITAQGNRGDGMAISNTTRIDAQGLVARDQQATTGHGTGRGVVVWRSDGAFVDLQITGNAGMGMFVHAADVTLAQGAFLDNGGHGLQSEAKRTRLSGIEAHGNQGAGIVVLPAPHDTGFLQATGLRLHDNDRGLQAQDLIGLDVRDLRSEQHPGAGVSFQRVGNITWLGSVVTHNAVGLQAQEVRTGQIEGVRAVANEGAGFLLSASHDLRLQGNTAKDNGGSGFVLDGTGLVLRNNQASGNVGFGIQQTPGTNATLIDNDVTGNGAGGLSDGLVQQAPGWPAPLLLLALALVVLHQRP